MNNQLSREQIAKIAASSMATPNYNLFMARIDEALASLHSPANNADAIKLAREKLVKVRSNIYNYERDQIADSITSVIDALSAQSSHASSEPEFTDSARNALLWLLWHHQGASSDVGQTVRFVLGMGQHDRMSDEQVARAKQWKAVKDASPESLPADEEVGQLEYAGNSVAYLYQKMQAREKCIDEMWSVLRKHGLHSDGETSISEIIDGALASTHNNTSNPIPEQGIEMVAARLRRVAGLVGLVKAIPEDDHTLFHCAGSVLGMIAHNLERDITKQKESQAEEEACMDDAVVFGCGYMVNGVRIDPKTMRVFLPLMNPITPTPKESQTVVSMSAQDEWKPELQYMRNLAKSLNDLDEQDNSHYWTLGMDAADYLVKIADYLASTQTSSKPEPKE